MNKKVLIIGTVLIILIAVFITTQSKAEVIQTAPLPQPKTPEGTPDINGGNIITDFLKGAATVKQVLGAADIVKAAIPAVGSALGLGSGAAATVVEAALPAVPAAAAPAAVEAGALAAGATAPEAAAAAQVASQTVAAGGTTSEAIASGSSSLGGASIASLAAGAAVVAAVVIVAADAMRDQGFTVDPKTGQRIWENPEFDYTIDKVTGKHIWEMTPEEAADYATRMQMTEYAAELAGFTDIQVDTIA